VGGEKMSYNYKADPDQTEKNTSKILSDLELIGLSEDKIKKTITKKDIEVLDGLC
jgi:hypothetical protein